MHKILMTALVVLIGVPIAVTLFAQAPAENQAPEKMMENKEMKPKMMSFSGEVTNMDMGHRR